MWRRFPPAYYRKLQGDEREGGEESRIRAAEKLQDNQDLAAKYKVETIPTLVVFEGGKEVKRSVGVQPKPAILAMLK